jgi:DNA-binding NarL/FixJ family response regulator
MGVVDDLHRAREAYQRRDWLAAYWTPSEVDESTLTAADFTTLATTAYLLGRHNDCVQASQRAYQLNAAQGEPRAAARCALWLAMVLFEGGEPAIAHGWIERARRLLDEVGDDAVEHGYLLQLLAFAHITNGELTQAAATVAQVTDYGRRFNDPDLLTSGLCFQGRLQIYSGRVADGLHVLDEAMVFVLSGEVSPVFAGLAYCSAIEACQEVCDFGRAGEWTHALSSWCDTQPTLVAFTGQCAVHRGQLMRLHGAYDDALTELDEAITRYHAIGSHPAIGLAYYECGETHRLRGAFDQAESAYDQASAHGHPAQPGRALLWLAQGLIDDAAAVSRRLLIEATGPVHRSTVLPVAVAVFIASGDIDAAATAQQELSELARSFGCSALLAAANAASAQLALAQGDPETALRAARAGHAGWSNLEAPYESAQAQTLLARALRLTGDEASAHNALKQARQVFAALGATPAQADAAELLGHANVPGGLSPREVQVLRLVAAGHTNTEIAAALMLSEKTVARHLSNIFTKLDVGSRTAAAAFAYKHRLLSPPSST